MCYGKQDEKGENSKAAKKERKNQGDNFFFSFLKRRKEKNWERRFKYSPYANQICNFRASRRHPFAEKLAFVTLLHNICAILF